MVLHRVRREVQLLAIALGGQAPGDQLGDLPLAFRQPVGAGDQRGQLRPARRLDGDGHVRLAERARPHDRPAGRGWCAPGARPRRPARARTATARTTDGRPWRGAELVEPAVGGGVRPRGRAAASSTRNPVSATAASRSLERALQRRPAQPVGELRGEPGDALQLAGAEVRRAEPAQQRERAPGAVGVGQHGAQLVLEAGRPAQLALAHASSSRPWVAPLRLATGCRRRPGPGTSCGPARRARSRAGAARSATGRPSSTSSPVGSSVAGSSKRTQIPSNGAARRSLRVAARHHSCTEAQGIHSRSKHPGSWDWPAVSATRSSRACTPPPARPRRCTLCSRTPSTAPTPTPSWPSSSRTPRCSATRRPRRPRPRRDPAGHRARLGAAAAGPIEVVATLPGDGLALTHARWRLELDGGELAGRGTIVSRRQPDGSWLVVLDNPMSPD